MNKAICNDNNTDEFFLLYDANDGCYNILDKKPDLVLLPPDNIDGYTENEVGDGTERH